MLMMSKDLSIYLEVTIIHVWYLNMVSLFIPLIDLLLVLSRAHPLAHNACPSGGLLLLS